MEAIKTFISEYLVWMSLPRITLFDIIEILILAFTMYKIIIWVKNTRAWMLVKGIIVLLVICLMAILLEMNVILWIFKKSIGVGITALVIIFQPELRSALEQLGRKSAFKTFFSFEDQKEKNEKFTEKAINDIVKAVFEMAKAKTGALIVVEQDVILREYERTGIVIDSLISSQILINIFEHNTPLHDGAIILRNNRIVAATCYLPLSDNLLLSKDLGTRHRAGVGVSEVSDALIIIVSEETGVVSVAYEGVLTRFVNHENLKQRLLEVSRKTDENKKIRLWKKRWRKNEKEDS